MLVCGEREAKVVAPSPMCVSAVLPCFHNARLSSTGFSQPQSPLSHPLNLSLGSQQQPSPWDYSTIPKLQFPDAMPFRAPASLSGVCMAAARTVWFSSQSGCHRSAVSLSALNVSPLTQTIAAMWGSDACSSSPTCWVQIQSYQHSHFPPSSFILLSFAWVYTSPSLVRYSCLLSAGVLHALLCLKVYFWCIHGERCTPLPPISLPTCSPPNFLLIWLMVRRKKKIKISKIHTPSE